MAAFRTGVVVLVIAQSGSLWRNWADSDLPLEYAFEVHDPSRIIDGCTSLSDEISRDKSDGPNKGSDVASFAAASTGAARAVHSRSRRSSGSGNPCNNCRDNVVKRSPEIGSSQGPKGRENKYFTPLLTPARQIPAAPSISVRRTRTALAPTRTPGPLGANERFVSNRMAGRADPSPSDAIHQGTSVSFSLTVPRKGLRPINLGHAIAPAPAAAVSKKISESRSVSPDPPESAGIVEACQMFFGSWQPLCNLRKPASASRL